MQRSNLVAALGLMGATMLTTPAGAQSGPDGTNAGPSAQPLTIETVIVTATRRPVDLEQVPIAVTAVSPETLHIDAVKNALDLQDLSPSLTVSANLGSRDDNVFTIRGQSQPFGGADPGVQTYFNEVPFGASGPGNYYDMENIQILRGPQGTLFGRNTTGGAVLFQPKRPTEQSGGYLDVFAGDFAMHEVQGAINLPFWGDKVLVRVAGDTARRNGFTQDVATGSKLDDMDYDAFRAGVLIRPFAGFENYTVFDYHFDDTNGTGAELSAIAPEQQFVALAASYGLDPQTAAALVGQFYPMLQGALANQQALGIRKTTSSIPLFYKRQYWSVSDIARYDFTDHLRLRNIFGYLEDREQPSFDYDGSFMPLLEIPNPRTWEQNSRQITEELQLQGEIGPWSGIFGGYYEHDYPGGYSEVERDLFGGAGGPFPLLGSTEIDKLNNGGTSKAIYASLTYDVSGWVNGLSLTAGGRYTWDHKVEDSTVCVQSIAQPLPCPYPLVAVPGNTEHESANYSSPSWTFAANYQITPDTMLYGTYRRGYKSGGFNGGAAGTGFQEFKPEYLTDLEVGTKNNWTILGVPGRTNFDLYYGWYQDIQKNDIVAIETIPMPPAAPPPPRVVALTVNAAKAEIKGLEFESTFIPNDNVEVSVFYSYTDAGYGRFQLPQAIVIDPTGAVMLVNPLDHKGDAFAYTPKHKLGASGRVHLPINPTWGQPYLTATWYWQSKVWFTDLNDLEPQAFQGDYGLINLRLDWNNYLGSAFDLGFYANNVTNRNYKVGANALQHLIGTTSSIYGAPRMIGAEIRFRFGGDTAK